METPELSLHLSQFTTFVAESISTILLQLLIKKCLPLTDIVF